MKKNILKQRNLKKVLNDENEYEELRFSAKNKKSSTTGKKKSTDIGSKKKKSTDGGIKKKTSSGSKSTKRVTRREENY